GEAEYGAMAAVEEVPVSRARGVQLTASVADENDVAATHPLKGRISRDGRRCRVPGAANADDPAALESRPVGGSEGEAHRIEIDQGPYRLAQSLENVVHLEAGSEDRRERRGGRQAFTAAALAVQDHDRLHERADELGHLTTGRRVRLGIQSRRGAHDDERTQDAATDD